MSSARRPPAAAADAPPQLTKAQRAQRSEAEQLRTAVQALEETEEVGASTLAELGEQGDQLRRIRRKVDETDAHIDRGNWILRGMKSWFGARGKPPPVPSEVVARREKARGAGGADTAGDAPHPSGKGQGRGSGGSSGGSGGGGSGGRGSAGGSGGASPSGGKQQYAPPPRDAATAEADAMLDALSGSLTRVKGQATAIRDELATHDAVLDDVGSGVERVRGKIDKATATAKKLAS